MGEVGHLLRDLEVLLCPFPLGNKFRPVQLSPKSKRSLVGKKTHPTRKDPHPKTMDDITNVLFALVSSDLPKSTTSCKYYVI